MKIIMAVTNDRYELPVAVADSQAELARMQHMSESEVSLKLRGKKCGPRARLRIISLLVEDEVGSDEP